MAFGNQRRNKQEVKLSEGSGFQRSNSTFKLKFQTHQFQQFQIQLSIFNFNLMIMMNDEAQYEELLAARWLGKLSEEEGARLKGLIAANAALRDR